MNTNILNTKPAGYTIFANNLCCEAKVVESEYLNKIEIICRIALGVFATMLSPWTFTISLNIGFTIGAGYSLINYWQNEPISASRGKPICAQGYMNFLSGMRFSPLIDSLATTTFIGAHMRHDPQFYVPFCGLFLGLWLGREMVCASKDLGSRLFRHVEFH
jgi:hypothetical protein